MSWVDPPLDAVRAVVRRALREDLGAFGDLTAGLVPTGATVRAALTPRSRGVLAGRLAATEAFAAVDPSIEVRWGFTDGEPLFPDRAVAEVAGPLASVLTAERTALNLLGHLSGVATLTRQYMAAAGSRTRIRDTRKTTPGLRALEKAAVRAGGGFNHRASLSDGILVKDNHLAGVTITEAVAEAHRRWPGLVVEVECDTLDQVSEALLAGAEMVLVDNMTPDEVAVAVERVGGQIPVEVSGGVTLESVAEYAEAGAAFISVGSLTHSAPALDIGLDVQETAAC